MILQSYTRALRRYDYDLFAGRNRDGVACVFRKSKRFEPVCELDGQDLLVLCNDYQFVCAITDDWKISGRPRHWGIDHVIQRVKDMDLQANERFFEQLDEQNEKVEQSNKRHLRNEMEAFWSDERRNFLKATDDILIHSLSKDEPRKRLKDRSIKNGNS